MARGLILALLLAAAPPQDAPLTKAELDKALKAPESLRDARIEIRLLGLDGSEEFTLAVTGRGAIIVRTPRPFPTEVGDASEETMRDPIPFQVFQNLARAFLNDEILKLKPQGPGQRRFVVRLDIPKAGAFEYGLADFDLGLASDDTGRELIRNYRNQVLAIIGGTRAFDERLLSSSGLEKILGDGMARVTLEYRAVLGRFGGRSVRIHPDGSYGGIDVPPQDPREPAAPSRFKGQLEPAAHQKLLNACVTGKVFDIRKSRNWEWTDLQHPSLIIDVELAGVTYRKSTWLWDGEDRPALREVINQIREGTSAPVKY